MAGSELERDKGIFESKPLTLGVRRPDSALFSAQRAVLFFFNMLRICVVTGGSVREGIIGTGRRIGDPPPNPRSLISTRTCPVLGIQ